MNIPLIFWIVPAAAVIALAVAWAFYRSMKREDEGTPRMREIAEHVRKGAMAYLRQQYKVVLIVFIILALFFAYLAYGAGVQNPWVPFAFLTGGFFSGLAGYFGMKTATYASARTANAARQSLDRGLKVAFRSGAVMGLVVVGLGLLAIVVPVAVGLVFGVAGVMGLLVGGLSSGFVLAVFMANAGGAWDNAKKMVEEGHFGGKGSECHKATVVGDTVGDPFKDTSGPSLNILIKLMSMVSIVMAGLTVACHLF